MILNDRKREREREKKKERNVSADLDQRHSIPFFLSYLCNPINVDDMCRMFKEGSILSKMHSY